MAAATASLEVCVVVLFVVLGVMVAGGSAQEAPCPFRIGLFKPYFIAAVSSDGSRKDIMDLPDVTQWVGWTRVDNTDCNSPLYVAAKTVTFDNGTKSETIRIYYVDWVNGKATPVYVFPPPIFFPEFFSSLAFNPADSLLYGIVNHQMGLFGIRSNLIAIDPIAKQRRLLRSIEGWQDLFLTSYSGFLGTMDGVEYVVSFQSNRMLKYNTKTEEIHYLDLNGATPERNVLNVKGLQYDPSTGLAYGFQDYDDYYNSPAAMLIDLQTGNVENHFQFLPPIIDDIASGWIDVRSRLYYVLACSYDIFEPYNDQTKIFAIDISKSNWTILSTSSSKGKGCDLVALL